MRPAITTDLAHWWAVGTKIVHDPDACEDCGEHSSELVGRPGRGDPSLIDLVCPTCHDRRDREDNHACE